MAYVAISGDLITRVEQKINGMKIKELNTIGEKPDKGFDENSEYLLGLMWGEHIHLKDILPDSFVSKYNSFGVTSPYSTSRIYIYTKGNTKVPPKVSNYIDNVDWEHPEFVELKKWLDTEQEINLRWHKTKNDVRGFLQKCKSLNEAVKLWPDVEMYIDSSDLSRMNVKKEKSEKTNAAMEALKSLDTDALTANAVIARMSGV
jgi:hypothetical protein